MLHSAFGMAQDLNDLTKSVLQLLILTGALVAYCILASLNCPSTVCSTRVNSTQSRALPSCCTSRDGDIQHGLHAPDQLQML